MAILWEARWPSGARVCWRPVTLGQYQRYRARLEAGEHRAIVYFDLYQELVVRGPAPEHVPAGIVFWIGRREIEENPFSCRIDLVRKALSAHRERVSKNYLLACQAILASVFRCSFEEMSRWTSETFFERVAQAELVLGKTLDPVTAEEAEKLRAQAEAARSGRLSRPPARR